MGQQRRPSPITGRLTNCDNRQVVSQHGRLYDRQVSVPSEPPRVRPVGQIEPMGPLPGGCQWPGCWTRPTLSLGIISLCPLLRWQERRRQALASRRQTGTGSRAGTDAWFGGWRRKERFRAWRRRRPGTGLRWVTVSSYPKSYPLSYPKSYHFISIYI